MKAIAIIAVLALALAGCTRTVTKEVVIEVKVPVTVPCMGEHPASVTALIESLSRDEWDAMTTDQRANLLAAQAIERKVYGDTLTDASAGCRGVEP